MNMDGTLLLHQEIPVKNKRVNDYMQHMVSNNNNYKCECCPYGHHVNVDFVEFAKDISNSHNELQKIRRYQRKLERAQSNLLNKSDLYSAFPKESIILSRNFTNHLSCSSSDSNSSDMTEPILRQSSLTNIDSNKGSKSPSNDIVYIPNNLNDSVSRLSDDSHIQSINIDNEEMHSPENTKKDMLKEIPSPKTNSKINSYKSKSFVVSYEHLMSIREQMSTSLKRVQDLEGEVKTMNNLRQKVDQLSKENHQLKCELAQKKQVTEHLSNSKSEFNRRLSEISSSWLHLSDVPSQVIQNLERVSNIRLNGQRIPGDLVNVTKTMRSTPSQTDVSGNVIIDTISFLTMHQSAGPVTSPTSFSDSTKIRKRNFGVTVRPTHHNFTQQVSPERGTSPQLDRSGLAAFLDWLDDHNKNKFDRELGIVVHQVASHLLGRSYRDALDLLADQLQCIARLDRDMMTVSVATETVMPAAAVTAAARYDQCSQTDGNVARFDLHCKASQAVPESKDVGAGLASVSTVDTGTGSEYRTCQNAATSTTSAGTSHGTTQTTEPVPKTMTSVQTECAERGVRRDSAVMTDRCLIDDMIADQIEAAVTMIQQELVQESRMTMTCPSHAAADSRYWSPVVHNLVSSDDAPVTQHQHQRLGRCDIIYSHFYDDQLKTGSDSSRESQNELHQLHPAAPLITLDHELRLELLNSSDQSDCSGASSALEATYYSADGRIEYQATNQLEELNELEETVNDEACLDPSSPDSVNAPSANQAVASLDPKVLDQQKPPSFPQKVQASCELVGLWMNDSTTTCSKDLNESMATIRQFWFEVTSDSSSNLQYYMEKFSGFSPTLHERIINMTDSNGNTCLHYAVSEGRWSIVRLLLQTHKVNVNKTNNAGYTVLMLVAVCETIDEESLRMLLDESLVDQQSLNDTQQTALMIAASQGKTRLVQLLLEKGASLNIVDSDGSTALMCACDNGHLEVVRLLLSRSETDTELEDNTGSNAMKIAMDNSHKDIALLIFARNNLQKMSQRSKRRSGSSSHPTSPLNQRKSAK